MKLELALRDGSTDGGGVRARLPLVERRKDGVTTEMSCRYVSSHTEVSNQEPASGSNIYEEASDASWCFSSRGAPEAGGAGGAGGGAMRNK